MQTKVFKIKKERDIFELHTPTEILQTKKLLSQQVVSAPVYSLSFSKSIITCFQIHSSQYKSPSQIPKEKVLVVGGGNSGMQIAVELAKTHEVTLSISHPLTYLPLHLFRKVFSIG